MLDVRSTRRNFTRTLFPLTPTFSSRHSTSQFRTCYPQSPSSPFLSQVRSQTIPRNREMDGLSGCLCCLDANTLLSYAGCPFRQLGKSIGKGGPRDRGVCVDNKIFDTDWSRVFFTYTRTSLEDYIFSSRFALVDSLERWHIHQNPVFPSFFCRSLLIVL